MDNAIFEISADIEKRPPRLQEWLTRSLIVGVIVGIVSAVQVVYAGFRWF